MKDPALFAANWGALWADIKQLPDYDTLLAGRVVADLVNEARCARDASVGAWVWAGVAWHAPIYTWQCLTMMTAVVLETPCVCMPGFQQSALKTQSPPASTPSAARSKYGCQWDRTCPNCARGSELVGAASAAIRAADASALIAVNGIGQDGQGGCAGAYPGLNWGDGFITDGGAVARYNLSDPSFLFR